MEYKIINKLLDLCINKKENHKLETIIIDNIEIEIEKPKDNILNDREGEPIFYALKSLLFCIMQFGITGFFTYVVRQSQLWYVFYIIQFFLISIMGYQTLSYLKLEYMLRKKSNFNFLESDIDWTNKKQVIKLVIGASLIGIVATMLGIGGGMIINPILISIGMHPKSVMATGSVITMFSSAISLLQYIVVGAYLSWYLPLLAVFGGLASIVAMTILIILRNHGKNLITFCMLIVLIISISLFTSKTIIEYLK